MQARRSPGHPPDPGGPRARRACGRGGRGRQRPPASTRRQRARDSGAIACGHRDRGGSRGGARSAGRCRRLGAGRRGCGTPGADPHLAGTARFRLGAAAPARRRRGGRPALCPRDRRRGGDSVPVGGATLSVHAAAALQRPGDGQDQRRGVRRRAARSGSDPRRSGCRQGRAAVAAARDRGQRLGDGAPGRRARLRYPGRLRGRHHAARSRDRRKQRRTGRRRPAHCRNGPGARQKAGLRSRERSARSRNRARPARGRPRERSTGSARRTAPGRW